LSARNDNAKKRRRGPQWEGDVIPGRLAAFL